MRIKPGRDAGGFFLASASIFAVGGRPRVGDGGACIASWRCAKNIHRINHFPSRLLATRHFNAQHHVAAALLLFHQIGLRVIGKARVIHIHHLQLMAQPRGNLSALAHWRSMRTASVSSRRSAP